MKQLIQGTLRRLGYQLTVYPPRYPVDFADDLVRLCKFVQPYTQTTRERVAAIKASVEYLERNDIPGDFVECGVWRGGSVMAMASTLKDLGSLHRRIYLFDTFAGMPEPTSVDVNVFGQSAETLLKENAKWNFAPIEQVREAVHSTEYDPRNFVFVQGMVEKAYPFGSGATRYGVTAGGVRDRT